MSRIRWVHVTDMWVTDFVGAVVVFGAEMQGFSGSDGEVADPHT